MCRGTGMSEASTSGPARPRCTEAEKSATDGEPDNLKCTRKNLCVSGIRTPLSSSRTPAVRTGARLPAAPPEPPVWSPENGGVRPPGGG
jgi:hypothetical protein